VKLLLDKQEFKGEGQIVKEMQRSIEKIMIAHRNTKLFFIMMSGPFLAGLLLFKYTVKVLVLYFLYK
jgi:hypothetical protein